MLRSAKERLISWDEDIIQISKNARGKMNMYYCITTVSLCHIHELRILVILYRMNSERNNGNESITMFSSYSRKE